MRRPPKVWTIVVGGGSGSRFGRPKQYEDLCGERVIDRSRLTAASVSDGVVVVVPAEDAADEGGVPGGRNRSESVRAGLARVPDDADVICVHDAARPLATASLFRAVIAAVMAGADGAVPGIGVTDTIKVVDGDGVVVSTPDRSALVAVQTPQAFDAAVLRAAHADGADGTDDAGLVERRGGRIVVVTGEPQNRKITHADDLAWARSVIMEPGWRKSEERGE
ncbi:MAG: 2-C-methyl-D-erythritol 4-phosphate cytidylyltransferase [Ilumatobacter sp.]